MRPLLLDFPTVDINPDWIPKRISPWLEKCARRLASARDREELQRWYAEDVAGLLDPRDESPPATLAATYLTAVYLEALEALSPHVPAEVRDR